MAVAFAQIQVLDVVSSYHWPDRLMHAVFGLLALGFVVTLILAAVPRRARRTWEPLAG